VFDLPCAVLFTPGGACLELRSTDVDVSRIGAARRTEGRNEPADMTEPEARAALRAFVAIGELEQWIAAQRWEAMQGGWRERGQFHSAAALRYACSNTRHTCAADQLPPRAAGTPRAFSPSANA
jgi:hypothetical protein